MCSHLVIVITYIFRVAIAMCEEAVHIRYVPVVVLGELAQVQTLYVEEWSN